MSSSDSEVEDPRFRIPRGASDEEIDSDDAYPDSESDGQSGAAISRIASGSGVSRSAGVSRRGDILIGKGKAAKDIGKAGEDKVDQNEECSSEEGVLLSDLLGSRRQFRAGGGQSTDRAHVSAAAALLRPPNELALVRGGAVDDIPISDDEDHDYFSDSSLAENETPGHAELLEAATGRADFANRRTSRLEAAEARRRARQVTAGVGEEGPLKAQPTKSLPHTDALALMMGALEGKGGELGELKKKIGKLVSGEFETRPLDAPVPVAVSARMERSVAYEKTREEVSKWTPVVKRNRVAESLAFPLDRPGGQSRRTVRDVVSGFRSSDPFEQEIESLLVEAGVAADADVIAKEEEQLEAAAAVVSKDEIMARRRELARMRSVLFMHEKKLKRIKKIKSRKFRKMMKIEREKVSEDGAFERGSDDDGTDSALAAERQRVVERMTLRHKNTSKWVRRQLSRGEVKRNPASRAAVEDQLRLHEELRKKQENSTGLAGQSSDSESDDGGDSNYTTLKDVPSDTQREVSDTHRKGGLMGLRFMQQAQERRRLEAVSLLREMENSEQGDVDEEDELANDLERPSNNRKITPGNVEAQRNGKPFKSPREGRSELVGRRVLGGQERGRVLEKETCSLYEKNSIRTESEGGDEAGEGDLTSYLQDGFRGTGNYASNAATVGGDQGNADGPPGYTTTLAGRIEVNVDKPDDGFQTASMPLNRSHKSAIQCDASMSDVSTQDVISKSRKPSSDNPWLAPVPLKGSFKPENDPVRKLIIPLAGTGGSLAPGAELRPSKRSTELDLSTRKRVRFEEAAQNSGGATSTQRQTDVKPRQSMQSYEAEETVSRCERLDLPTSVDIAGKKAGYAALEQMELVAKAFAGAGGADLGDFEAAKAVEVERALPSAEDFGARILPGWGDWAGDRDHQNQNGAKRRRGLKHEFANRGTPESSFAKAAREKLEAARAEAVAGRRDSQLRHVVISARRAKMASELTASTVPFPYVTADQWEKEVATPVLRERLTHAELEKFVRPRVTTRKGDALQPLRMSAGAKTELAQIRQLKIASKGKSAVVKMRQERAVKRDESRRGLLD